MTSTGVTRTPACSTRLRGFPGRPPRLAPYSPVLHSVLPIADDHCTSVIRGEDDDFQSPRTCTLPLLVSIKGGGGISSHLAFHPQNTHSLTLPRYWHLPQSLSRDLGASLSFSPRLYSPTTGTSVQDNTVRSHTTTGRTAPWPEPG